MAINDMDSETAKGDCNEVLMRLKSAVFGFESMEKITEWFKFIMKF